MSKPDEESSFDFIDIKDFENTKRLDTDIRNIEYDSLLEKGNEEINEKDLFFSDSEQFKEETISESSLFGSTFDSSGRGRLKEEFLYEDVYDVNVTPTQQERENYKNGNNGGDPSNALTGIAREGDETIPFGSTREGRETLVM